MPQNENPLTRAYWWGAFDARPLAVFRILLGVVLLQDLVARAITFSDFLTEGSVYPRALLDTVYDLGLFSLTGDPVVLGFVFAAGVLATIAFTLGFGTRVATVACWVFWVSIHRRVPPIHTGGDGVVDILLFFSAFTNLSGRWSIDARRIGAVAQVHALVPRFMQLVPTLLYLYTAREKLLVAGKDWFFGPVIFQHMQLEGWIRPGGIWLGSHPTLCSLFTGATILTELALPLLQLSPVYSRYTRVLALMAHLGLQLGILRTLRGGGCPPGRRGPPPGGGRQRACDAPRPPTPSLVSAQSHTPRYASRTAASSRNAAPVPDSTMRPVSIT